MGPLIGRLNFFLSIDFLRFWWPWSHREIQRYQQQETSKLCIMRKYLPVQVKTLSEVLEMRHVDGRCPITCILGRYSQDVPRVWHQNSQMKINFIKETSKEKFVICHSVTFQFTPDCRVQVYMIL
jgi:hypothetical protein